MLLHTPKELKQAKWITLCLLVLSCVMWLNKANFAHYKIIASLPLHTALETATIVIFSSVFIVCWNAFGERRKKSSVILAVAFLCTAILGFFHAISFQGMPGFLQAIDMHKSLSFWLMSRLIVALTLLGLTLSSRDTFSSPSQSVAVLVAGVLLTAICVVFILIAPEYVPLTYSAESGQTTFKLMGESLLIGLNVLTATLLYRQAVRIKGEHAEERLHIDRASLFVASSTMAMSEVYFSLYTDTSDIYVIAGHVYQFLAATAIYRSMVAVNIHAPYATLSAANKKIARSADELSVHKERLTGIIETAIDGIITIDEHQNIILANPAAAAMFGYAIEQMTGTSLNAVIPERHRKSHGSHVKKFGQTGDTRRKMGGNFEDFYVTGLRASGEEFPIEASISSLMENGHRFYTVIFRDITERKIAKEKMAQYHSQLSQLSSALQSIREEERKHIARELHDDLGQLLAALRMDLSLLQRDAEMSGKSQKALSSMDQLILTSITTLRRIATDLRPRALDEGGLYFALQTLQKDFTQRHQIECQLRADEDLLNLDDAHSTAIFRIIQESLTNVTRHAKANKVVIEFERTTDELSFSISDNGRGIEEEDMRKSRSFGLVGMRERVKAMQGEFSVGSNHGEGTRIEIRLPLASTVFSESGA